MRRRPAALPRLLPPRGGRFRFRCFRGGEEAKRLRRSCARRRRRACNTDFLRRFSGEEAAAAAAAPAAAAWAWRWGAPRPAAASPAAAAGGAAAAAGGPPCAGGGRGGGVSVATIRALLARHGLLRGNLVFVESSSRFVCAPVAPGRRRPCPFVPDGHRSNRGTVVLRAVGGGAPPVATYYCYSGRCRGRSLALGAAK